jgi:hypothetical protein
MSRINTTTVIALVLAMLLAVKVHATVSPATMS